MHTSYDWKVLRLRLLFLNGNFEGTPQSGPLLIEHTDNDIFSLLETFREIFFLESVKNRLHIYLDIFNRVKSLSLRNFQSRKQIELF